MTSSVAAHWAGIDPRSALEWISGLPPGEQRSPGIRVVSQWAQSAPHEAAVYVAGLPPGEYQEQAVLQVVASWSKMEPDRTAAWVGQFPEGKLRNEAVVRVIGQWAELDYQGAGEFLKTIPEVEARNRALQVYLNHLSHSRPAEAAPWTTQLSEERDQHSYIERVVRSWMTVDPEAARTWLLQTSLPEERKRRILP